MKEIAVALNSKLMGDKQLVVPMFQRGKRWNPSKEKEFIESLVSGFPVGTMLFYKKVENNKEIYMLVDGLQRGNTIKKYIESPTSFLTDDIVKENLIDEIFNVLDLSGEEKQIKNKISENIKLTIQNTENFSKLKEYTIAKNILGEFSTTTEDALDKLVEVIDPFKEEYVQKFNEISNSIMPAMVYTGDEDNLPMIFDRINSKGIALTQYEIFAASWPDKKFKIKNEKIIEKILRKYDELADDEITVHGYNRDVLRREKEVSSFEYLFGLGKHLNEDFPFLQFDKKGNHDEINTMGFELLGACLNESRDGIKTLHKQLLGIDIVKFEERLFEVINFVKKIISPITEFKGNKRKESAVLYPKFLVLSMIANTFREKYDIKNLEVSKKSWDENRKKLEKNMLKNFVYDIISDEWSNGGTGKIYSAFKPNKYLNEITKKSWLTALDSYFEKHNFRNETERFSGVSDSDLVFLNCVYLKSFTALDQLSRDKFDVEHIAPKEQMKKILKECQGEGLPVTNIANLCYLPEGINRSKREKTFYQDKNYLEKISLEEVELKYSFTSEVDLEWINQSYKDGDYYILKEYYIQYLNSRFEKQKEKFFESMGIS